jgi:hypothetical protein
MKHFYQKKPFSNIKLPWKSNNSEHNMGPFGYPSGRGQELRAPSFSIYDFCRIGKTYALVKEYLKSFSRLIKMPTEIFLPLRLPIKRYTK